MTRIPVEQLLVLWDDGERRLRQLDLLDRRPMEAIVEAIVHELGRRLGGPFQAEQLAELYMEGTDWCFELAIRVRPGAPEAWDMSTVVGAAFNRYVRRAMDFGGGRRRVEDEEPESRR